MIPGEYVNLGHRYVMGNVNAYCPECSTATVVALTCDFDDE